MAVTIIFVAATVLIAASAIIKNFRRIKSNQIEPAQFVFRGPGFSVSEYMSRMEKAGIEIMQERWQSSGYQIVLWAGLDGLRLNDDGTTEWIRRDEKKPEQTVQNCANVTQLYNFPIAQNFLQQNMCCQTENTERILELQTQMQDCCIQQKILQLQQIMNSIHPPYIPSPATYYQSAITQCCAKPCYGGLSQKRGI